MPAEGIVCPVIGPIFSAQQSSNDTSVDGPRIPRDMATQKPEDGDEYVIQALESLRQTFRVPPPF